MKRRYLFRGKDTETNEWIYGSLLNSVKGTKIAVGDKFRKVHDYTVGLYLNINTSLNEKIFEDDIVELDFSNKKEQYLVTAGLEVPMPRAILIEDDIHFNGHEFCSGHKDIDFSDFVLMLQDIYGDGITSKIVGNLHQDNIPEPLLKAVKNYFIDYVSRVIGKKLTSTDIFNINGLFFDTY